MYYIHFNTITQNSAHATGHPKVLRLLQWMKSEVPVFWRVGPRTNVTQFQHVVMVTACIILEYSLSDPHSHPNILQQPAPGIKESPALAGEGPS